jgi:hypothetical protein
VLHTETSRSFRSVWKIAHDMGFEEQLLIRGRSTHAPYEKTDQRIPRRSGAGSASEVMRSLEYSEQSLNSTEQLYRPKAQGPC